MAHLFEILEEGLSEEEVTRLKEGYEKEKSDYLAEVDSLERTAEQNTASLSTEREKKDAANVLFQEKQSAYETLLAEKTDKTKAVTIAKSEDLKLKGELAHKKAGLEVLQATYDLVSEEESKVEAGKKLEKDAYTYHDWYLPKGNSSWNYEKIILFMGWTDEDYIESWRKKFKQSASYHNGYRILRSGNLLAGDPNSSPHKELKTLLDDRLGTPDIPGTFREELTTLEKEASQANQTLIQETQLLESLTANELTVKEEKEKAESDYLRQVSTVEQLELLISQDIERKDYLEVQIKLKDYQIVLLGLKPLRTQYERSQASLQDVDRPGDTVMKLQRLEAAISTLNELNGKYNEANRVWLKETQAKLATEIFNPVKAEEAFKTVSAEINAHCGIVDNINHLLASYQTKQRDLVEREKREREARKNKRECLVNELLPPDERVGACAEDVSSVGLINAYMVHRSNHWGTFLLDCLQSFWKKVVACVGIQYETQKEQREKYINETYKPALIKYREDGKKEVLEDSLKAGRAEFKSRTKPNSTGYEFTFAYLLKDVIEQMPSETDVVKEDIPQEKEKDELERVPSFA